MEAIHFYGKVFLLPFNFFFSHFFFVSIGKSWLPARTIVEKAVQTRFAVHASGELIVLDHVREELFFFFLFR
jgi:hypothetical protein